MKDIHFVSADEAVQAIKSGDHIHLSSVASVPHILIEVIYLCKYTKSHSFFSIFDRKTKKTL